MGNLIFNKNKIMQFAACVVSVVPVRKSPAHESEMVNQLLFGETMEVLETAANDWYRIRSSHDQYEGWVSALQVEMVNEDEVVSPNESFIVEPAGIAEPIHTDRGVMYLPFGSSLARFDGKEGMIGNFRYRYEGNTARQRNKTFTDLNKLQRLVEIWIQAPYLWGGRTMMGVDCSGLIQVIFKVVGIDLFRDASQQATQGVTVDFLQQAQCGDLAFFDDESGNIYHVGILLNTNEIVHASGQVRKDNIDNTGIFNKELRRHTHRLRIIKRLL
jgi:hypothetical protein